MTVDFNNLRKQTAYSLDRVIKILNEGITKNTVYHSEEISEGQYKHFEGDVLIEKENLQKHIDELRSNVWILLCCFEKNNPEYACVYEEVEKSGGLARFNDEDDENELD